MKNRCLIHKYDGLVQRVLHLWNRVIDTSSLDFPNNILNVEESETDKLTQLEPTFLGLNSVDSEECVVHDYLVRIYERLTLHLHD